MLDLISDFQRGKVVAIHLDEQGTIGFLAVAAERVSPTSLETLVRHADPDPGLILVFGREHVRPLRSGDSHGTNPYGGDLAEERTAAHTDFASGDYVAEAARIRDLAVSGSHAGTTGAGNRLPLTLCQTADDDLLVFPGPVETVVELTRMARLAPSALVARFRADTGIAHERPRLAMFIDEHGLQATRVRDVLAYKHMQRRVLPVQGISGVTLPTEHGVFQVHAFEYVPGTQPHLALVYGDLSSDEPVLSRIHSECLTGDVLGSLRCDCGTQLSLALERISAAGRGVLIYLRQEGRGIGLSNKLRAYSLQDQGLDTVEANIRLGLPADVRDFSIAAKIFIELGIRSIDLLTNNPLKLESLTRYGLNVRRKPLVAPRVSERRAYLEAKAHKMGHLFHDTPVRDADQAPPRSTHGSVSESD